MVAQADERRDESPQVAAETIAACQRGDFDAFEKLFASHKDRVYSIALRFAGDPAAALDITQDIFLKLLKQIQSFRGDSKFETWLYRLVVNACMDHQRAKKRWLPLLEEFTHQVQGRLEPFLSAPLRNAQRAEVSDRVQSAVAGLPADQRIAVVLRYTEGLSYEEISVATGCRVGTVASRLNRAHRALEGQLKDLKGDRA